MNNFCYKHIFKIHIFQKHFWAKCAEISYKCCFISSSLFAFLIINVQILFNFQKEWCTFGRKKGYLEKKERIIHFRGLSVLSMQKYFWFVSNFEHVNFANTKKNLKNIMTIQTIMFHLWSFKHIKCSFKEFPFTWWLLWLCFYPIGYNYNDCLH
jgi:hypothetical protein